MDLTLHISADLECKLLKLATVEGKAPEQLVVEVLADHFSSVDSDSTKLPLDHWLSELDALAFATPAGSLGADLSREAIYEGRGE